MVRYDDPDLRDRKLFIGGLSYSTDDYSLRNFYSQWGEIIDAVVMRDHSGRSRGFGFVTYSDADMAQKAHSNRPHNIDGRVVDAKFATPKDESAPEGSSSKKIFIGGLSHDIGDDQLRDYFAQFGRITDSVVMIYKETREPRGFGFVTYETTDEADAAISAKPHKIGGQEVDVKKAVARTGPRPKTFGGRMGGGKSLHEATSGGESRTYGIGLMVTAGIS
ncbi:unnamed protein product [Protopolystoma xenopodis]|uniref:RRM domain-containing protein n=1 Tax=Protopolystoma xenopodis TaxID=117903 RepID=A0A448X549_9PLAT|nr:unnamed protein product [Protopolystoma xenopodis]